MSLRFGDILDPKKDAAALAPVFDEETQAVIAAGKAMLDHAIDRLNNETIPALAKALGMEVDGLTITITVAKKKEVVER